jgi:hypothetical protein
MKRSVIATWAAILVASFACGDNDTASPTPTQSATVTTTRDPVIPFGEYPDGFIEFARELDAALSQGDAEFFEQNTWYGNWECPNNYYPGGGPNCAESTSEGGTSAIVVGVEGSEGTVYDVPSYVRYMSDWMYDVEADGSDEYGSGLPRVYAIADHQDRFEPDVAEGETLEIVATRIAEADELRGPSRGVMTFFITDTSTGWLITHLLVEPVSFLDVNSVEAQEQGISDIYVSWQRWEEPAPSTGDRDRWAYRNSTGFQEVAYIDGETNLHVTRADGTKDSVVTNEICDAVGGAKYNPITWSPGGSAIAVGCAGEGSSAGILEVYSVDDGTLISTVEDLELFRYHWAPRSPRIAYEVGRPSTEVRVHNVETGEDVLVHANARLLDWPEPERLILGLEPTLSTGVLPVTLYEAVWFDIQTGATERIPRFDDSTQFWLPDGGEPREAIVLSREAAFKDDVGLLLAVYDLGTGAEITLVVGTAYPSEGIPRSMIEPGVGEFLSAAALDLTKPVVSLARTDGSYYRRLGEIPGLLQMSLGGLVMYSSPETGSITLLDTATGAETVLEEATAAALISSVGGAH